MTDDDRLGDLGLERKSAAERLAEIDKVPDEGSGGGSDQQDPKAIANRYTWVVGVAAIVVVIIVLVNSASHPGRGYLGLATGSDMPEFAAPIAASGSQADANVRQASGGAADEGAQPACEVHGATVLNICDLQDKPIVITFVTKGCQDQLDTVQTVSGLYPEVNFVGVIADVNHPEVPGQLVQAGGWTFPIAADNDAAVFNLYRAGSCPTTVFAKPGGKIQGTALNEIDAEALGARVKALVNAGAGEGHVIPERSSYGWIDPDLAEEFPRLGIHWMVATASKPGQLTGRSPGGVRERLRMMSDRVTGAKAVNLRQEEVPAAYRIFFRQIGIDPDSQRTPPEEVAIDRLFHGGHRSRGLLADAITVAIAETGVGVFALDADKVSGEPGLRLSDDGETLGTGEGSRPLSRSQIMLADRERALAVLFGDVDPEREVTKASQQVLLVAIRVGAITELSVEEALWTVAEMVSGQGG